MVLWYLGLFIVAFLLGMGDVSPLITFFAVALYIIISIPFIMPLIWSKNPAKMLDYLRKSRSPYYKFLYLFFSEEYEPAEKIARAMRPGKIKDMALAMLYLKQKQFAEAKEILAGMKEGTFKNYYFAVIALEEGDHSEFVRLKEKVSDSDYRRWLDIEELAYQRKFAEAISMMDADISRLKGIKLLSAIKYREELIKRESGEGEC
ncbi:hypothetical protein [Bacillus sp. FJAT-27445]|uniref:hypothetical protein n=1 Tax=Bacillus sp. FJAT-27445 TaxID=1679166 RepID=UPI0007435F9C|nr:hypothetical protein [Bacillus sp. FJAT-27445]